MFACSEETKKEILFSKAIDVQMRMFDVIDEDDILDGTATDAYFLRTEETLEYAGRNPHVVAEIGADQFPNDEQSIETYEVFAGVHEVTKLLDQLDASLDAWALPEGSLFDGGPVMRIEGKYLDFARYETSILGFLSHASGIATNAFRAVNAAETSSVLSFGARHVHPSMTMVVERNALVGGVDGFSHVAAGEHLGREASGTMPHALMLSFGKGNQEEAWRMFNEAVDESVPRIPLCDTFTDEKDEVLRAVAELGDDIEGVRIDTTGSRRGDFRHIIKEVKWALDVEANVDPEDVDIYVSGGISPDDIRELDDVVDGFGVGSYISNADPVDFSLDIVEIDGEPITKRGKNAGVKNVFRETGEMDEETNEVPIKHSIRVDADITDGYDAFEKIVENGDQLVDYTVERAQEQLEEDSELLL